MKKDGTVYFIEATESRRIKIGFTAGAPVDRMKQLQTGQPERLRIVATVPGDKSDERELHRMFAASNITGEWFERNDMLVGLIRGIRLYQGREDELDREKRRAEERAESAARDEERHRQHQHELSERFRLRWEARGVFGVDAQLAAAAEELTNPPEELSGFSLPIRRRA